MGEAFLRFDFAVAVGDGVGDVFLCLGEAVGDGLGVDFFAERFRCLRVGTGVGVGARIFLIFVPNDSSAAPGVTIAPTSIATIRNHRNVVWKTTKFVGRFRETPSSPLSDTDALQFVLRFPTG